MVVYGFSWVFLCTINWEFGSFDRNISLVWILFYFSSITLYEYGIRRNTAGELWSVEWYVCRLLNFVSLFCLFPKLCLPLNLRATYPLSVDTSYLHSLSLTYSQHPHHCSIHHSPSQSLCPLHMVSLETDVIPVSLLRRLPACYLHTHYNDNHNQHSYDTSLSTVHLPPPLPISLPPPSLDLPPSQPNTTATTLAESLATFPEPRLTVYIQRTAEEHTKIWRNVMVASTAERSLIFSWSGVSLIMII